MSDTVDRQAAIDAILAVTGNSSVRELYEHVQEHGLSDMWSGGVNAAIDIIIAVPSAQPKSRHDDIADFVVYQINWLKSHHDLEMEPVLEDAVVQMLKDTGKCYIDETEPEWGG